LAMWPAGTGAVMGNRRRSPIRSLHRTRFGSVPVQGGDVGMVEGPFSEQTASWTPCKSRGQPRTWCARRSRARHAGRHGKGPNWSRIAGIRTGL